MARPRFVYPWLLLLTGCQCSAWCETVAPRSHLCEAARRGERRIVISLLGRESPNLDCGYGYTPLMLAAQRLDGSTATLLLRGAARSYYRNYAGQTAADCALVAGHGVTPTEALLRNAWWHDIPDLDAIDSWPAIRNSWAALQKLSFPYLNDPSLDDPLRRMAIAAGWLGKREWKDTPKEYERSLTRDVYVAEVGFKKRSPELLRVVAEDLETKVADCKAAGAAAAGALTDFEVTTVTTKNQAAPGWYVRFKPAIEYWPEALGQKKAREWRRFHSLTEAKEQLVPGPYRMFVEHPTDQNECPKEEWVLVGRQNPTFTFPVCPRATR